MESGFVRRKLRVNTITKDTRGTWEEVKVIAPLPPRRCNHSAEMIDNKLVIYGGQDISEGVLDDLWILNLNLEYTLEEKWTKIPCGPESPGPLCRHSSVAYKGKKYILGGTDLFEEKPFLFSYDPTTNAWESFETIFKGLDSHTSVVYKDSMIVFGGYQQGSHTNHLSLYDFTTNAWQTIRSPNPPEPRADHTSIIHKDSLYIHGGTLEDLEPSTDLWRFDLTSSTWQELQTTGTCPGPLSGHTACLFKDVILVFGGVKDILKETNEMYYFDLECSNWAIIQTETESVDPVFDREEYKKQQKREKKKIKSFISETDVKDKVGVRTGEFYHQNRISRVVFQGRVRGKIPHSRDGHTSCVYQDYMIVFGGDRHRMPFNDLYLYSINENLLKNN